MMQRIDQSIQPGDLGEKPVQPFNQAYQNFSERFQTAWTSEAVKQHSSEKYQQVLDGQNRLAQLAVYQQLLAAWKNYVAVVQDALAADGIQAAAQDAYRNYLRELRQAWAECDLEQIDPRLLAQIGQSISAAAFLAAAVEGKAE